MKSTHVSIRLSPHTLEAVQEIMILGGFRSIADALRHALGDELFLLRERSDGWSVLLAKGHSYREVEWPR